VAFELAGVVVAVRLLGLVTYGSFQTAAVTAGLAAVGIDMSRQTLGTRDVSATMSLAVYASRTSSRRLSAGLLTVLAVLGYAADLPWVGAAAVICAGAVIEQRWAILASTRSVALGVSYLVRPIGVLLALAAADASSLSANTTAQYALPLTIAAGGAAVAALDQSLARRHLGAATPGEVPPTALLARLPLTVAALLAAGYVSGDLLLVRLFAGSTQAGVYALAYKPVTAVLVLVALFRDVWLAAMAREGPRDRSELFRAVAASAVVVGVLAATVLIVRPLFLLAGAEHADPVTALLLASVLPIVVSSWLYAVAVTTGRLAAPLPAVFAALVTDVAVNALLVPWWGAMGGAAATLVAEVVSTGTAAWVLYGRTPATG
jgi:O-antigen/teichoic acid export membrane protein